MKEGTEGASRAARGDSQELAVQQDLSSRTTCSLHCRFFLGLPYMVLYIYNWLSPKDGPTMETVGTVGGHAQGTKRADTDVGPRVGNKHPTSSLRGLQPEAP